MEKTFDCSGWATKANLRCSDGRVIMRDAFADCDGKTVPCVWNHQHNEPENVLGHALLENREDGVYTYVTFNDTDSGKIAKSLVQHGDVTQFSIYANRLKEEGKHVVHGIIREVSLVLAGANPGAFIDSVMVHNEDGSEVADPEQGVIWFGEENAEIQVEHSEEVTEENSEEATKEDSEETEVQETEIEHAEDKSGEDDKKEAKGEETIADVYNSMTDKQKLAVAAIVTEMVESKDESDDNKSEETSDSENKEENNEEDKVVKHNLFENDTEEQTNDKALSHADGQQIIKMAKDYGGGSLKAAMEAYATANNKELAHTDPTDLGFNNISSLFPEYKDVRPGAPELLTTDQGWISTVMRKVHKSPISRIRTRQADARDISGRRAKAYTKQTEKGYIGNLSLLGRTTDPVTVYVKSKLDRDDIIDITDFNVVDYLYQSDRMNLNEELATAIMIGDGREDGADGKIDPTKIRPIWTDDELYTIHANVDIDAMAESLNGTGTAVSFGENYVYAEAIIQALLYAREQYKGSGNPDFFCDPHIVNVMLLARDMNGRRIYDNVGELKAALNVNSIVTAEQFADKTRTITIDSVEHTKKLLGIMVNLADYSLGATKGGEITHFTDFDIHFNQQISLLETRCSGALTRVKSAIALETESESNP